MNKIQRIVFTMACLLTSLGGYSYMIVSMGSYPLGRCTVTATYNNQDVTAGTTDIPASTSNNVTIHITNITPGYYLDKIEYEYVTDLGQAEAPRRANDPGPGIQTTKGTISRNSSHTTHYAGDYGLAMQASDIIITAILQECTSISTYSLTLDGTATSLEYNGAIHTVTLKNGETTLEKGTEYGITTGNETYTNVSNNEVTLTGWGRYNGIRSATLSITAKTLTIITDDGQSKVYGASDPVFTYTYSGLCSDDQITGALGRAAGENVGSYAINIGDLTAGSNYSIAFTPKDFVINAKDLSAVALTISLDHDYFNYNGAVQKAEITGITYGNTTLNSGSDYNSTFTYGTGEYGFADNTTPDIYPITVTFKGNYTGSKTVDYQIRQEITLNNNGHRWRTYYNKTYNMEVTNDFEAFTVSSITTNSVILNGPREVIKSATPMLLYRKTGTASGIYPALIKSSDARLDNSYWTGASTYLKCHVDGGETPTDWDLDNDGGITGGTTKIMILVDDKFAYSKSGTLAAGKCYLDVSPVSPSPAPSLFIGTNPTGIEEETIKDFDLNGVWYTLDGRQIQGVPAQKGIYIKNGKKIIIK